MLLREAAYLLLRRIWLGLRHFSQQQRLASCFLLLSNTKFPITRLTGLIFYNRRVDEAQHNPPSPHVAIMVGYAARNPPYIVDMFT